MATKAAITLVGHLGRDPESKYLPSGAFTLQLNMAVSRRPGANAEEITNWYRVAVWGKVAERLDKMAQDGGLAKGSLVCVLGDLLVRDYQKQDGTSGYALEVNASDVLVLGSRS